MGLPGSGKTYLAKRFSKIVNAEWLNADKIRGKYNDWDFSEQGIIRQVKRMKNLAQHSRKKIVVADFVCPTKEAREKFEPDFVVWMDTIPEGRYEDTNRMFENPQKYDIDYHVAEWFNDTHTQLVPIIERYMKKQNTTPIGYVAHRLNEDDI